MCSEIHSCMPTKIIKIQSTWNVWISYTFTVFSCSCFFAISLLLAQNNVDFIFFQKLFWNLIRFCIYHGINSQNIALSTIHLQCLLCDRFPTKVKYLMPLIRKINGNRLKLLLVHRQGCTSLWSSYSLEWSVVVGEFIVCTRGMMYFFFTRESPSYVVAYVFHVESSDTVQITFKSRVMVLREFWRTLFGSDRNMWYILI